MEAVELEKPVGFIDSLYSTKTDLHDYILMPECGMSRIYDSDVPNDKKHWKWLPFDTEEAEERCINLIKQLLRDNDYLTEQTRMMFISQFSEPAIENVAASLNLPMDNFKYIGDRYAYTGTSSPLLAYYHALADGEIKPEDVLIFCSFGSGLTAASVLYVSA
jgi:3-oxoacyl-[acyl-carrier-protein] synthase-3